MVDMGLEPFLVASSVNLIMAQRLVRRLCKSCSQQKELHPEVIAELCLSQEDAKDMVVYEGEGCVECNSTGYKGRLGVYEVMPITPGIREQILDRAPTSEVKKLAVQEGMLTLRAHALTKLKEGLTSVEEVLKETAADD
jgi:type IV pilus assembly protein PilB